MYKIEAVAVFFSVLSLVVSDCISNVNLPNLETGTSTLQMQPNQLSTNGQNIESLLFTYNPKITFSGSAQIIFGIYNLESSNINVDQMLLTANSTSNGFQFKYNGKLNAWASIKISYLAAFRSQFILGIQNIVLNSLKGAKASNSLNLPINFNQPKANVYLNGFSLNSINSFDLNISIVTSQANSFSFQVSVGPNMDAKNIYVSYIIYDSSANFVSESGNKNFINIGTTQSYLLQQVMPDATYMLYGLSRIKLAQNSINLQLEINKDSIVVLSAKSNFQNIGLDYNIFGKKPIELCANPTGNTCSSNTDKYYDRSCVSSCPPNTYQYKYLNGGVSCRICSNDLGLKINQANNGCVCLDGSDPQNGDCQTSIKSHSSLATVLNTPTTTYQNTGFGLGSNLNAQNQVGYCQSIPNSYWNGFICACQNNYVNISNQCLPKDSFNNLSSNPSNSNNFNDYFWNIPQIIYDSFPSFNGSGSPNSSCAANETYSIYQQKCVCINNYIRLNGVCQLCLAPNIIVNGKCVSCPINSVYSYQLKICDCYSGYTYNSFTNLCDFIGGNTGPQCNINQNYNYQSQKCQCKDNYTRIGNICVYSPNTTCPIFQIYNTTTKRCQQCGKNEISVNNQCVCNQGFTRINGVCSIKCDPDQFLYEGKCARCPENRTYNGTACICKQGFIQANGYCSPNNQTTNCPSKQYYNNTQAKCLSCIPNCQKCSAGSSCQKCSQGFQTPLCTPKKNDTAICGNGKLESGEDCDDNNLLNGDGCNNQCKVQSGYKCTNITGETSKCNKTNTTIQVCGNGKIDSDQICDDSNTADGDGCTRTCKIQSGYNCTGQPSICVYKNSGYRLVQYGDAKPSTFQAIVLLKTDPVFTFTSETQKRNFIKQESNSTNTTPDRVFCNQDTAKPQLFSCLLLFNAGIPNTKFSSKFSYSKDGQSPSVQIEIRPQQINALRNFG